MSARIISLDGLRGLAALSVVVAHAIGALARPPIVDDLLRWLPVALLINGIGAVQLFFVLSGYCLTASLQRADGETRLGQYYIRRAFRIHPPFAFGLLLAWVASFLYLGTQHRPGLSLWIGYYGTVHLGVWELLRGLAFPGGASGQMPVGWTIYIEMVYSLLLPAMLWISVRTHWGVLLCVSAAAFTLHGPLNGPVYYVLHFTLGIIIYMERDGIGALFRRLSSLATTLVLLLGASLLALPRTLGRDFTKDGVVLFALGAMVLTAGAIHSPRFGLLLSSRPIRFLGRISYSLYLVHFTVLLLSVRLVERPLSGWEGTGFVLLVVLLSCAVAWLSYHAVELPAIRMGNRACAWVARRTGSDVQPSRIASID